MSRRTIVLLAGLIGVAVVVVGLLFFDALRSDSQSPSASTTDPGNPIGGLRLYRDDTRDITGLARSYADQGKSVDAALLTKITDQPGTTWLIGPSSGDTTAQLDIRAVSRTSIAARNQRTTPVYELYAIPGRDACAGYSRSGFTTSQQYLTWIDQIIAALQTPAIFAVEADAIAQTIQASCLSDQQITDRYALLNQTVLKLTTSGKAAAVYLDTGHSEWFADPAVLYAPLKASGIDMARGIAVNTSFFVTTQESAAWSRRLLALLGSDKGAIIDTSRNGRGVPADSVTGDARFCNPAGRALGNKPTTDTDDALIDAYIWIKKVGESDGDCFGNPPAGTLIPEQALELSRNASY